MRKVLQFVKKHIRNTFYSNVWIAFAAFCACYQFSLILELDSIETSLFVGASTLFVYNFQRLVKLHQKPQFYSAGRANWIYRNRKVLLVLTFLSGLATLILAFQLNGTDYLLLTFPALLSVFYAVPFKVNSKKRIKAMRSMPYIKLFLIAFAWSFSTVLFPAVHAYGFQVFTWSETGFLALEQFAFIAAISIPFDVRDLKFDSPSQKTIPQVLGVRGALTFAMILLAVSFCCLWFLFQSTHLSAAEAIGLAIGNLVAGVGILLTRTSSKELYFTGFLDGTIVLKFLLYLVLKSYI